MAQRNFQRSNSLTSTVNFGTNSGLSGEIWEKEKVFIKRLNAALTFTSSTVLAKVLNPTELLSPYI